MSVSLQYLVARDITVASTESFVINAIDYRVRYIL